MNKKRISFIITLSISAIMIVLCVLGALHPIENIPISEESIAMLMMTGLGVLRIADIIPELFTMEGLKRLFRLKLQGRLLDITTIFIIVTSTIVIAYNVDIYIGGGTNTSVSRFTNTIGLLLSLSIFGHLMATSASRNAQQEKCLDEINTEESMSEYK